MLRPARPFQQAGLQAEFALDTDIYAQDSFLPGDVVAVDEQGFVRQQRIARVTIHPVQFNPAQGQVKVYHIFELRCPSEQLRRPLRRPHPKP